MSLFRLAIFSIMSGLFSSVGIPLGPRTLGPGDLVAVQEHPWLPGVFYLSIFLWIQTPFSSPFYVLKPVDCFPSSFHLSFVSWSDFSAKDSRCQKHDSPSEQPSKSLLKRSWFHLVLQASEDVSPPQARRISPLFFLPEKLPRNLNSLGWILFVSQDHCVLH